MFPSQGGEAVSRHVHTVKITGANPVPATKDAAWRLTAA